MINDVIRKSATTTENEHNLLDYMLEVGGTVFLLTLIQYPISFWWVIISASPKSPSLSYNLPQ
jgi:hypothetical protein